MRTRFAWWPAAAVVALSVAAVGFYVWPAIDAAIQSRVATTKSAGPGAEAPAAVGETPSNAPKLLSLSAQARQNLGLVVKPVRVGTYTKTISVPGVLVDRPGVTDRGVTSSVVGTVAEVHAFPGETVGPGEPLFSLRLYSEYLQQTQKELFQARSNRELNDEQLARYRPLAASGAVARTKIIELEADERRLDATIAAQRHDLLSRGLTPAQIDGVEEGEFVSTIEVSAPLAAGGEGGSASLSEDFRFEVQSLAVELGQQVQAGQLLVTLADHRSLLIEGHAFKREAASLARAAEQRWPIDVEFEEDDAGDWPPIEQTFTIQHLANVVDPESRTFDFYLPLTNQSRAYERDGEVFAIWRFRPGQRVRLHVPVEQQDGVITLPSDAVVREGPEAFVFQQNGDLFRRLPVHVLHEDRRTVVIANDGSVPKSAYLAQGSATTLNRVLKAQEAGGEMPGVHVHADGSVHASH